MEVVWRQLESDLAELDCNGRAGSGAGVSVVDINISMYVRNSVVVLKDRWLISRSHNLRRES